MANQLKIPSNASSVAVRVARGQLIGTGRKVELTIEISLDDGDTWGGEFVVKSNDLFKRPHIAFPLTIGAEFDGAPPLHNDMPTDSVRGTEIPPEQGATRWVRFSLSEPLPARVEFGYGPHRQWPDLTPKG